jgi:hypothetical protein
MHANTIKRALHIKHIVDLHFEPGNQRRCMGQVWRAYVVHTYPCSLSTFYRLVGIAVGIEGYIGTGGNRINKPKRKILMNAEAVQLCLPM